MLRFDTRTMKAFVAMAAVACLTFNSASAAIVDLTPAGGNGSQSATSVLLSDLIADVTGGAKVGDKIFTGFGYSKIGDMPNPNQINVLGIKDVEGNWGITFHGSFIDLPGNGPSDALVRYMVEVEFLNAQQGIRITDAHLNLAGVGAGDEGFLSVDETFAGFNNNTLSVYFSNIGPTHPPADAKLSDVTLFNPGVTKLNVTKDIFALAADNSSQITRATAVDQSFSQTGIPEPTCMVMLGISGLALVGVTRRRG